jgi:hypothetical protein
MNEHDVLKHWIQDFVGHPILGQTQMEELCLKANSSYQWGHLSFS